MGSWSWRLWVGVLMLASAATLCAGVTEPQDVMAINNLYLSLGSPPLTGWLPFGGDPCGEGWQGVTCISSNITEIRLSGMGLEGYLSDTVGDFGSIAVMDFSNNHIGGSMPSNLPSAIRNFSVSGNQLNGSIPFTFSFLSQLLSLSLSNNLLSGSIPDMFQKLTGVTSLDMSGNNFTGQLPPSMGNLMSLKTLHLQNNMLTGTLEYLTDLPLTDLNVENNLFSGPIPPKLLTIPNFRRAGTPFNTTIITSPPPTIITSPPLTIITSPPPVDPPPIPSPPSFGGIPWEPAKEPSTFETHMSPPVENFWNPQKIILVAVLALITLTALGVVWRCCVSGKSSKQTMEYDREEYKDRRDYREPSTHPVNYMVKVPREPMVKPFDGYTVDNRKMVSSMGSQDQDVYNMGPVAANSKHKRGHSADVSGRGRKNKLLQPPLPPPVSFSADDSVKNSSVAAGSRVTRTHLGLKPSSITVFSIATLQQYTNSFSVENFIGEGSSGNVYRAELPDGKLLAVKKLSAATSRNLTQNEFYDLISVISKLKHENVLELQGFCDEYAQRLLVYEYCVNRSLYDALHVDDEAHERLTWDIRIRVALGASRALQYLHEVCKPPMVHQNLKSTNVLLAERLAVRVSECGLAPLTSSHLTIQMSGYAAPELDRGAYSCQSDIYSLGVVMLELLTGRKAYDRSRPRGEQFLAGWAIPQLHDIDALMRMVDPSLYGAYHLKSLSRFADIISRCLQSVPDFRPSISEIVQDLQHMI